MASPKHPIANRIAQILAKILTAGELLAELFEGQFPDRMAGQS